MITNIDNRYFLLFLPPENSNDLFILPTEMKVKKSYHLSMHW